MVISNYYFALVLKSHTLQFLTPKFRIGWKKGMGASMWIFGRYYGPQTT